MSGEQEIWIDIERKTLVEELGEDRVLALGERDGEVKREISTKRQELEKTELTVYKKRTGGLKSRMVTHQKKVLEMKEIPQKNCK